MDYQYGAARHGQRSRVRPQPLALIGPGFVVFAFLSGCQATPPPPDPVHSASILGLDSGAVEFRIHAFSRAATIRNPLVRLGFRLFGRREQIRFARHACERMSQLVTAELADKAAPAVPRARDTINVVPAAPGR